MILVDVIAKKDGEFVADLTIDDFEVYEDGEKVKINSFELMSFGKSKFATTIETDEAPSEQTRAKKLAVIFDGINTWYRDFLECSPKLKNELVSFASQGNEVMVLQLSTEQGLDILQPIQDIHP